MTERSDLKGRKRAEKKRHYKADMAIVRFSVFNLAFHSQHFIIILIFPVTSYDPYTWRSHSFAGRHNLFWIYTVNCFIAYSFKSWKSLWWKSLWYLVSQVTVCGKWPGITAALTGDVTGSDSEKICASYDLE